MMERKDKDWKTIKDFGVQADINKQLPRRVSSYRRKWGQKEEGSMQQFILKPNKFDFVLCIKSTEVIHISEFISPPLRLASQERVLEFTLEDPIKLAKKSCVIQGNTISKPHHRQRKKQQNCKKKDTNQIVKTKQQIQKSHYIPPLTKVPCGPFHEQDWQWIMSQLQQGGPYFLDNRNSYIYLYECFRRTGDINQIKYCMYAQPKKLTNIRIFKLLKEYIEVQALFEDCCD
eukprot:TRINITY_DN6337_c0_g1_i1.p1 TRINITY_DN6337_c0_g1~~TRINITY_DN6337_c0_g1_i1.p1  ORF type:complete len:231 (-),score=14.09 TRINITY_DN6337_c0_g1_i1:1212-1904(-)